MATDTTFCSWSQRTNRFSSGVGVRKLCTLRWPSARSGPHTQCSRAPRSIPATWGWRGFSPAPASPLAPLCRLMLILPVMVEWRLQPEWAVVQILTWGSPLVGLANE